MTFDELFQAGTPAVAKRDRHLDSKGRPPLSGRLFGLVAPGAAAAR